MPGPIVGDSNVCDSVELWLATDLNKFINISRTNSDIYKNVHENVIDMEILDALKGE